MSLTRAPGDRSAAPESAAGAAPSSTQVYTARDGSRFTIRHCANLDELGACVELQIATWGYEDADVVPRRLFLLSQKIGGQVIGAFDEAHGRVVGFAMGLPGLDNSGEPYLHSHMLAVLPELRDQGLGRELKLAQRRDLLQRGVRRMEWTFDPLEQKNAYLNVHRLGVVVRRYSPNFYGVSSSRLQAGLPTDRLHDELQLGSPRVRSILGETPALNSAGALPVREAIMVPAEVADWKQRPDCRERLATLQAGNRDRFLRAFAGGLAVTGFRTDEQGNGIYELTEWEQLNQI